MVSSGPRSASDAAAPRGVSAAPVAGGARPYLGAAVAFVVLFGFLARASTYRAPLLDHHAWRQADTASIARNFVRERFNPLYPQVDQRGALEVGYVETGLELFAFLVAAVSTIAGFHPEIGRLLAAGLFVISALLAHGFLRRRYGEVVGLVGVFAYAFGFPLLIFIERAFMNEPLLICLSLASLRAAQAFLASGRKAALAVLVVSTALVGMIKVPYLIVLAPIVGLFAEQDGMRVLRRASLYLIIAVDLMAAGAWYYHAHGLAHLTAITFGLSDKLFDAGLVFSWDFVAQIGRRFFKDLFGLSLPFLLVGAVAAVRQRRLSETFGLAGCAVYYLVVAKGNFHHDYYQLPIMLIAPALVGVGIVDASRWIAARTAVRPFVIGCLACGAIVVSSFARSVSAHSWYSWDRDYAQACEQSQHFLLPGDRLMFVDEAEPTGLFCMDRKGWLLGGRAGGSASLEHAWRLGATVAILRGEGSDEAGRGWIRAHGALIYSNPAIRAYRLQSPAVDRLAPRAPYPQRWWAPVPREAAADWEILPQEAGPGEVIVSKRHELGLLSNLAATPFVFRGKRYASLEGFWQMMLYPDGRDDPRATFPGLTWPHARDEVAQMTAFEAKAAGTAAEQNMVRMGIDWVSFEGRRFAYRPAQPGEHYALIAGAMREKVRQNPDVQEVLLATGDLVLKPDHREEPNARAAWRYCQILMEIRNELRRRP